MRQRPTCDLCNSPLDPSRGVHTFQTDQAELDVHPECAMQLFNGVWDELETRHARGEYAGDALLTAPREEVYGSSYTPVVRDPAGAGIAKAVRDAIGSIDTDDIVNRAMSDKPVLRKAAPTPTVKAWAMNDQNQWVKVDVPTQVRKAYPIMKKHGDAPHE